MFNTFAKQLFKFSPGKETRLAAKLLATELIRFNPHVYAASLAVNMNAFCLVPCRSTTLDAFKR
jgi:hypothetical protein